MIALLSFKRFLALAAATLGCACATALSPSSAVAGVNWGDGTVAYVQFRCNTGSGSVYFSHTALGGESLVQYWVRDARAGGGWVGPSPHEPVGSFSFVMGPGKQLQFYVRHWHFQNGQWRYFDQLGEVFQNGVARGYGAICQT